MSRRSHSNKGFTLVELMVTVLIIGVATAMALPTVQQALADRRLQGDGITWMQCFRDARLRAMMRGQAQLLRATLSSSSSTLPTLRVIEGATSSCNQSLTTLPTSIFPATTANYTDYPRYVYDLSNPAAVLQPNTRISMGAVSTLDVCFNPSGRMFWRTDTAQPFTDSNLTGADAGGSGAFNFLVFYVAGSPFQNAVRRHVILPLGGMPRMTL